ncbi:MAG: ABC transporter substrate-binding protein [Nitrosopumilaceae archaeon]|nr:ABC transporter substrate-binding protein [Nitrosopumilaceae archaeon]
MGAGAAYAEIPDEVVVGGVFDITGNWATEGEEGKTAAQLAILDFNEYLEDIGADWRMKMRVEDAQAIGSVAFDKVQTLHGSGINILLGMAFSSPLSLSTGYIESNNMLALSCCSQAGNLAVDDNIFRLVPNDNNQAPAVNAMIEDSGIEVLVMVTRGDTWGDGIRDTLAGIYDGTIVAGFRYNPDAIDFSAEISLLDKQLGELVD